MNILESQKDIQETRANVLGASISGDDLILLGYTYCSTAVDIGSSNNKSLYVLGGLSSGYVMVWGEIYADSALNATAANPSANILGVSINEDQSDIDDAREDPNTLGNASGIAFINKFDSQLSIKFSHMQEELYLPVNSLFFIDAQSCPSDLHIEYVKKQTVEKYTGNNPREKTLVREFEEVPSCILDINACIRPNLCRIWNTENSQNFTYEYFCETLSEYMDVDRSVIVIKMQCI